MVGATQPDIVVVFGGHNDYDADTSSVFGAVASSQFEAIKAAAPNAEVTVVSPIWVSTQPTADFATLIDEMKVATATASAETTISSASALYQDSNWSNGCERNVWVNRDGMTETTARMAKITPTAMRTLPDSERVIAQKGDTAGRAKISSRLVSVAKGRTATFKTIVKDNY